MPLTAEDFRAFYAKIKAEYKEEAEKPHFSLLLMGEPNSGKTSFLKTCRKPILVDTFDPLGDLALRKKPTDKPGWASVDDGSIIVRRWINEKSREPTQYKKWDEQFQKDLKSGFLSYLGTYCIDSTTTLLQAVTNEFIRNRYVASLGKQKQLSPDNLDEGGYIPVYKTFTDIIKLASTQTCDFVLTIHLVEEKRYNDDGALLSSSLEYYVFKGLKVLIPTLFAERYAMKVQNTAKDSIFKVVTAPQGLLKHAGSKLGGKGILETEEEPDMKAILKKLKLPTDDKPF